MPGINRLTVAKTLRPHDNGAKRFARRYGAQLVCVRQRLSADGLTRHTTVELLVESTPVATRERMLVALRIPPNDKPTRALLMACGARWHPQSGYWTVAQLVAKNLGILKYRAALTG